MLKNKNIPYLLIVFGCLSFSIGLNITYYNELLKTKKENKLLNHIFDVLIKEIEHQEILQKEARDAQFI
jgi:hypothetical protein